MSSPAAVVTASPAIVAHKFGGTSVASADRYRQVGQLLQARPDPLQVTVVSAMKGVTDALIELARLAAAGDAAWRTAWQALRQRHHQAAGELLGDQAQDLLDWLDGRFDTLADLLQALAVIGGLPEEVLERVQGLGEVFSAQLLGRHLRSLGHDCAVLDARDVLVVEHGELGVVVDWQRSAANLAAWRTGNPQPRVVVTGFVARDDQGRITTLGRNGSDYSGAIFAALFAADELHIWTDVDGVLSADPRAVPEAVTLQALSYDEACELAYFGAKVVHPQTMGPAIARQMPIIIRNTFNPGHPGTRIAAGTAPLAPGDSPIKGLTLSEGLAVLNLEGSGLIGVPGTAERVFAALRHAQVSVVMISQGSSEHSICCVVRHADAQRGQSALLQAFAHELGNGQVARVSLREGVSVLAAVGDGMAGRPGVAARLFQSLAAAGVNILAIAQGASERNISVAIDQRDAPRALRAAHAGFWLSPQTFAIAVIGPGNVGSALIRQLLQRRDALRQRARLDLRLLAVASRKAMLLSAQCCGHDWAQQLADSPAGLDLEALAAHLQASELPHRMIIDCSGSSEVAERYAGWLAAGIHVVTPNKQAGAGPLPRYNAISSAAAQSGARFRYEATVGAGLPVITTLRDLLDTGDQLLAVEGIFSGTLAWLFNKFDGSVPFSALVAQARALGYTEPDPRDDLSGVDVARKLVILAREAGQALELDDVQVQSLVPAELQAVSVEDFMAGLAGLDATFAQRLADARAQGQVLRYVARLVPGQRAEVGLVALPADHGFAHLRLTDNVVQFTTSRYHDNPLVVQGPGAGPEVTAAGVFADVLRVAAGEGARL